MAGEKRKSYGNFPVFQLQQFLFSSAPHPHFEKHQYHLKSSKSTKITAIKNPKQLLIIYKSLSPSFPIFCH